MREEASIASTTAIRYAWISDSFDECSLSN